MQSNFFTRAIPDAVVALLIGAWAGDHRFFQQFVALRVINELSLKANTVANKYFPNSSPGYKAAASFLGTSTIVYLAADYIGYPLDKLFLATIAWRSYLGYHFNQEFVHMNEELTKKIQELQQQLQVKQEQEPVKQTGKRSFFGF